MKMSLFALPSNPITRVLIETQDGQFVEIHPVDGYLSVFPDFSVTYRNIGDVDPSVLPELPKLRTVRMGFLAYKFAYGRKEDGQK